MSAGTVLVTGGAGYVGSHTCKALALAGYVPVTYDNLCEGHAWAVRWGPFEDGDIRDRERIAAVLERYRPLAVIHLAARAYVAESVSDPAVYYDTNVQGALVVLDAMRSVGVKRLVFSSTCAVYGVPAKVPIDEDAPQDPVNAYGWSKLIVERVLRDYASAYGLASVSLRYFNAAGADPDGEIGEDHSPETHLIPLVLEAAAGHRPSVMVYGGDYTTPDGTCVRDYVHVSDIADAHVLALRHVTQTGGCAAFNLGNGRGFSVREVITAARRVTGVDIPWVMSARRPGDPDCLIGDSSRIRSVLGWSTRHPDLDSIVATAWRWRLTQDRLRKCADTP
ncbi:MAG: UDP-glucose 4-epimerase GalE [Burkholderiales bacterium]|jgi:UDP-arabinose 4-epimerase|nr:UDP-glucose 4-epimerase GalE [Burkholderiales bacterium]